MAPVHRRPQRLAAVRPGAMRGRQGRSRSPRRSRRSSAVIEASRTAASSIASGSPSTSADLARRATVLVRKSESRGHGDSSVDEQLERLDVRERGDRQALPIRGNVERRQDDDRLPGDLQALAAGAPEPALVRTASPRRPPTAGTRRADARSCRARAIGAARAPRPSAPHRSRRPFAPAPASGARARTAADQGLPIRPARPTTPHRGSAAEPARAQREPALADPARTGQRDHVRARKKPLHLRQLAPAPTKLLSSPGRLPAVDCFSSFAMPQPTRDDRATSTGRSGSTVPLMWWSGDAAPTEGICVPHRAPARGSRLTDSTPPRSPGGAEAPARLIPRIGHLADDTSPADADHRQIETNEERIWK